MTQAFIDRFAHGTRSGAASVGMTGGQIVRQVRIAPRADAAAAIGRDVVCAPSGLIGSRELLPVVQCKEKISRRMALAAVSHCLDEIRAAIPLGAAVDMGFKALIGVE